MKMDLSPHNITQQVFLLQEYTNILVSFSFPKTNLSTFLLPPQKKKTQVKENQTKTNQTEKANNNKKKE